jgi:predicted nuclease of predicted toxin-antitoxin system
VIRLLSDENVPLASVRRLRDAGWDVAEVARGAADMIALARAALEQRVIVTFDRDFGRLALRGDLPRPAGVVLLRLPAAQPEEPAEVLLSLLGRSDVSITGRLTVIGWGRIRQRPLVRET